MNASGVGIGAVLSQEDADGSDHPVAYYSWRLNLAETHHSVTEQVCLAVVEAIRHFRVYVSTARFRVIMYHRSLVVPITDAR